MKYLIFSPTKKLKFIICFIWHVGLKLWAIKAAIMGKKEIKVEKFIKLLALSCKKAMTDLRVPK